MKHFIRIEVTRFDGSMEIDHTHWSDEDDPKQALAHAALQAIWSAQKSENEMTLIRPGTLTPHSDPLTLSPEAQQRYRDLKG